MVAGESGSGSAIAADVWSNSASGENMIKGETDAVADDEPAPAEKKESTVNTLESSGSGQQSTSEELEGGSGANLAEGKMAGNTLVSRSYLSRLYPESVLYIVFHLIMASYWHHG